MLVRAWQQLTRSVLLIVLLVPFVFAFAEQAPNTTSRFHFRQHPQVMAPHRPIPPRLPETKRRPVPPPKAGSVVGGIWMTDANFKSVLNIRSIIATTAITVKPILYLSNGTRLPLADVKLDPDGVAVIDLNEELAKQGISSFATLSGYVEVQYNWPWSPICATVRALDPVHSLLFYYTLQSALHVALPKFRPGQAPIQPPPPNVAAQTLEGLWWKQESNVTGFVGLANTTGQPLTATVNVSDQQANQIAQHTVTISPHGMKLVDLAELASTSGTSGGITVTYKGLRDDLLVDGALQDPALGYSAMLPFAFVGAEHPDTTQMSFAELGLMVGAADPMLSFPAGTTFMPYSVLRNISDTPVTATPTLWWMASGSPQYADVSAITLAPHQSQLLDMTSVLASAGLTNFAGSVNLVFDAQAKPGSLVASGGSVDKANTYVFAVYPRGIQEGASKSLSYWSIGNGDDTMVTLWNPADEAQNLVFRLNYTGGHYLLPIQLGPKATQAFNISDVVRNGTPDAEGNIIPASAHEGSATLMGSQGKIQQILVAVDAATYNVKRATCGGQCWQCDGIGLAWVDINNFLVASGGQRQESFLGMYDDTDWQGDISSGALWSSDNTSIMTVNGGMVTGRSLGSTNIWAFRDDLQPYNPNFCCQTCLYCDMGVGGGGAGTVKPTVSIQGNLGYVYIGHDAQVTQHTNALFSSATPTGGSYQWSSSDSSISFDNSRAANVHITATVYSGGMNDTQITLNYTSGGQSAPPSSVSLTKRLFKFLAGDSVIPLAQDQTGYIYQATYRVFTNPNGQQVTDGAGIGTNEIVTHVSSNVPFNPNYRSGALDGNSQVVDTLALVSNGGALPPNLSIVDSQDIAVGGFYNRTNTLTYTSSGVTVTNKGPFN